MQITLKVLKMLHSKQKDQNLLQPVSGARKSENPSNWMRVLRLTILSMTLTLTLTALFPWSAAAEEGNTDNAKYEFRAQLIWASNDNLDSSDLKPLDTNTTDKLRKVFKWQNYWEINRKYVELMSDGREIAKISSDCELSLKKIKSDDESKIEVVLFGKQNPIVKKTQPIHMDECLVLAGPDKDGTAWFVILTRIPKIPASEREKMEKEKKEGKTENSFCSCLLDFETPIALNFES